MELLTWQPLYAFLLQLPEPCFHWHFILHNSSFATGCVCVCVCVCVLGLSRVRLFVAPWTVAHQTPLPVGFPRQEYWSGVPLLTPGDLPNPGIKPVSPALVGKFFTTVPPGKPSLILTKANTPPPFSSLIFSTLSSLSLSLLLLSYKSL